MTDNEKMRQEFPHSQQPERVCVPVCTLWLVSAHVYDSARMLLDPKGEVTSCAVTRVAVQGGG